MMDNEPKVELGKIEPAATVQLVHHLKTPEGTVINALGFRRAKARDHVDAGFGDTGVTESRAMLRLMALLSGIHESAIEEMDGADYVRCQEVVGGFFGGTPGTPGS